MPIEADIYKTVVEQHEEGVTPEILNKVRFFTGDACRLKEYADDIGTFDGVVMQIYSVVYQIRWFVLTACHLL